MVDTISGPVLCDELRIYSNAVEDFFIMGTQYARSDRDTDGY